jgi:hypothetical protein
MTPTVSTALAGSRYATNTAADRSPNLEGSARYAQRRRERRRQIRRATIRIKGRPKSLLRHSERAYFARGCFLNILIILIVFQVILLFLKRSLGIFQQGSIEEENTPSTYK